MVRFVRATVCGAGVVLAATLLMPLHTAEPAAAWPAAAAAGPVQQSALVLAMNDDPSRIIVQPPASQEAAPAGAETAGETEAGTQESAGSGAQEPAQQTEQQVEQPQQAAPAAQPSRSESRPNRRRIAITDPPLPPERPSASQEASETAQMPDQTDAAAEAAPVLPAEFDASTAALENGNMDGAAITDSTLDANRLLSDDGDPLHDAEQAIREELEMGPRPSFPLTVSARLTEDGTAVAEGLIWRVFRAQPQSNGSFEMVGKSREPSPSFLLPAEDYIVHVAYGLANSAKRVTLASGPVDAQITLDAGGLRITCIDARDQQIPERQISISIYSSEEDEYGQRRLILDQASPRRIIRLNPGTYHVVSRYGDANAIIRADIQVRPGELTEARIQHRAASVTLKLVNELGGEALANTNWTILTPEGETIKESYGAFPSHVLMAGQYTAVARHDGRIFNRDFDIEPGRDREIELVAR